MSKWARRVVLWGVPAAIVATYAAVLLTNANLGDLFANKAWGGLLYANVWQHIAQGNFFIDPQYVGGEYFIVGNNHFVTYFGVMPALVRGLASVAVNTYAVNLTNVSMMLATLLGLGSVWYAVLRLARGRKGLYALGASIVLGLLLASPLSYLLAWSWTYHEVILWGVAWALLFVSLYTLWVFDKQRVTKWHVALMGLAVGMAVQCRPTIGLMVIVPFAYMVVRAIVLRVKKQDHRELSLIWPGAVVCGLLALLTLGINYQRWGNPFTFVQLDRNVQFVQQYPERAAAIKKSGEFNVGRLPSSLYYYMVPTRANVSAHFPFITLDRQLAGMNNAPQYDYIEGSRLPLPISMTFFLVLAGLGISSLRRFKKTERAASTWLLVGGLVTYGSLLTVYAVALRYSAEFIPPLVFLALVYLVALQRGAIAAPNRAWLAAIAAVGLFSLYVTCVTMLEYKEFVWDIPPQTRSQVRSFINYTPKPTDTKHIINGVRFPVY